MIYVLSWFSMNAPEEKAVWYLRLNGFFPIVDFVIHENGSDTDILAIRPPWSHETVYGIELEEDDRLRFILDECGVGNKEIWIGVIAEVKGGLSRIRRNRLTRKFSKTALRYCLRRLGLFKKEILEAPEVGIIDKLHSNPFYIDDEMTTIILKVIFANKINIKYLKRERLSEIAFLISFETVKEFFERRLGLEFKERDWDKFSSVLIQERIQELASRRHAISQDSIS